jgi:hypothetical protein
MLHKINNRWVALLTVNVMTWCVLGFYSSITAAPQQGRAPFANAVEQRAEMVRQLQEMNGLLKEQNAILRSGKMQVVITSTGDPKTP